MKERIFIFDKFDKLLAITNQYVEAVFEETVEKPVSFSITFPMSDKNAAYFVGGNQVAFKDLKGNLRLFTIREVDDIDGESPEKVIHCMPAIQELADVMVANGELENEAADAALGVILKHSRWKAGNVADLGLNSISFAYQNAYACIGTLVELWGGEIVDRVEIEGNKISCRYLDIVSRKGADTGKRFEMNKDIKNITRTVLYYPKTALYGQGKSLQSGEGSSDKVTFRDIEWKKENGDPTNKPKGQEWVGDPEALEKHGVPDHETGKIMHRFGLFEDNDEEEPEKLLAKTWEAVQAEKTPKIQYEMDIITFYGIAGYEHEQVILGDTGVARDKEMQPMLLIEARIMSWKYDIGNPRDGSLVLGNILDLSPDNSDIDWVIDKVKEGSGKWDAGGRPITDERFPDIVPNTPQNISATGLFKKIMLSWDFESTYAIAAYEVYASQINGFVPDPTNLVFRGKVGAYNFDADTDQKWYFRICAVNTHGTASDYSEQVSASTVQLDLPDIEDIVPDFIEYGIYKGNEAPSPKDYKFWLDTSKEPNLLYHWDETSEAWKALAPTNADELGAVDVVDYQEQVGEIVSDLADKADFEWVGGKLVSKANKDDVYTIEQLDNKFDNVVSKTMYETDKGGIVTDLEDHESRISQTETDIKSKVSNTQYKQDQQSLETSIKENKSSIEQNAKEIASKVSAEQYKTDKEGIIRDLESHGSLIRQNAKSISSKVDATYVKGELGKIEVGGRNLYPGTSKEFKEVEWSSWNHYPKLNEFTPADAESTYTANIYYKNLSGGANVGLRLFWYDENKKMISESSDSEKYVEPSKEGYVSITRKSPDRTAYIRTVFRRRKPGGTTKVAYKELKLEKGIKATDWTPAPEDVEAKINNIQVGGRNLVKKSDVIGWSDGYTFDNHVYRIINKKSAGLRINHDILEPKTEYVMSFRIKKIDGSIKTLGGHMHDMEFMKVYMDGEYVSDNWSGGAMVQYSDDDNEHKVIVHFKTTGTITDDFYIQPNRASGYAYNYSSEVWDLKVEKGNKPTDWTHAPEDTQAEIKAVEQYASEIEQSAKGIKQDVTALEADYSTFKKGANSTFEQQADQIASRVTEKTYNADMDNMTTRVSKAESSIKQNADNIELRVSKNGVVSSINQSPEQIKISAERVSIDGDLVVRNGKVYIKDGVITDNLISGNAKIDGAKIADASITNAKIGNISADKIRAGILDASKVLIRVVNGTQAIQLDDKGFESIDNKGNVRIHIGVRDIAGKGQSDPSTIRFFGGRGNKSAGVGMNVNDTFVIGSGTDGVGMELRTHYKMNTIYYAREHRFVMKNERSNGFQRHYFKMRGRTTINGDENPCFEPDTNAWGYVGTTHYHLWKINAVHINETSIRSQKRNIEDLPVSESYRVLNALRMRQYNYVRKDQNNKVCHMDNFKSFGVISDEAPDEVLGEERTAVRLYAMISHNLNVTKDLIKRIEELEKIIKGES
ncbi:MULTISPECIES: phage tail protein [Clostridia]|uniref:phage tail protein n=1 Tax=Clostridia TaxID=186801 RepID=UPI000EA19A49|nr:MULTISPECIES: phage tail protein [Clostridia]NBJ70617.1 hypothetical protein [Roseburia sp. 1XD42-34]RKI76616.1 hypothetical protein D7V87_12985 [Clostridium sp. 1xD42-85]